MGTTQHVFFNKSVRNNYGNFYKNLMKPQGGTIINKFAPKKTTRTTFSPEIELLSSSGKKAYNAFD